MENDQNRTNLIMIIVLIAVILLIAVLVISNHINSKQKDTKKQDNESSEVIEKDTSVDQSELYKSYEIGDQVILLDSSSWHVIKKTSQNEERITLLKDTKLTTELKVEEATSFLTTSYLKLLKDNLSALSTDIEEIRLITLDDIKEITKVDTIEAETLIERENISWLFQEKTLTSNTSSNNLPLLICEEIEEGKGRICEGTKQEIWPVRPVITISKEYIKE